MAIIAYERDCFQHAEYVAFISQFPREMLVFADESSKDDLTSQVTIAWFKVLSSEP